MAGLPEISISSSNAGDFQGEEGQVVTGQGGQNGGQKSLQKEPRQH